MLTWTCHVCGKERPDALIAVETKPLDLGGVVQATQNIRYCTDDPECVSAAKRYSLTELGRRRVVSPSTMMAYQGREDCTSDLCRRFIGREGTGCLGWHCAVCHEPSSQYGHPACHPEQEVVS